ncbi:MAG: cytochrome c biogenesis protein CcsA [Bernardetiaceae bacterium]|nr:cytochrome c biogenesis protein CcsA [Bernardetiaceae bacterium]
MKTQGWKLLSLLILIYTIIGGFLIPVPRLPILNETVRNLFFHVPMWFGMLVLLLVSLVYSIRYLRKGRAHDDDYALEFVRSGIFFGILGILTGMWWAKFTWGDYWSGDPKQNASAIALLIYLGYMLLRNSVADEEKRAKIAAVYNIFAFAAYIPLIYILPRLVDSLHPGAEGNPAFSAYDYDNQLKQVFYIAILGWTLLGVWLTQLHVRLRRSERKQLERSLQQTNSTNKKTKKSNSSLESL